MTNNKQKNQNKNNFKSIDLEIKQLFPDIDEWPESWAGCKDDIPVGKVILNKFKLFLYEQKDRISRKTLKGYGNYLWDLGGEIIRDTNENEIKTKDLDDNFLLNYVDESGGPYWRHANNEQDHNRYDSICRRLFKYLIKE